MKRKLDDELEAMLAGLLGSGLSAAELAMSLNVSERTVRRAHNRGKAKRAAPDHATSRTTSAPGVCADLGTEVDYSTGRSQVHNFELQRSNPWLHWCAHGML